MCAPPDDRATRVHFPCTLKSPKNEENKKVFAQIIQESNLLFARWHFNWKRLEVELKTRHKTLKHTLNYISSVNRAYKMIKHYGTYHRFFLQRHFSGLIYSPSSLFILLSPDRSFDNFSDPNLKSRNFFQSIDVLEALKLRYYVWSGSHSGL